MANCCVTITDNISLGSCTSGDLYGTVQIALHQVGATCLRDSSGDLVVPGKVGDPITIGSTGFWSSGLLCANSELSGNSYYTATVRVNGRKQKPIPFMLRADLSPEICGSIVRLSEVSLCGNSCVSGSLLCSWFNTDCCGTVDDGGGTDVPFTCADLASCSIGSLADVSSSGATNGQALIYQNGQWIPGTVTSGGVNIECCNTGAFLSGSVLTINQSNGSPITVDLSSIGGAGSCDSRLGVCSIIQNDSDTLTVQYGDGSTQIINISSTGTGGSVECCNTGAFLSGNTLTITQTNGSNISVDLSTLSLGGGGSTECCNTGAFLSGSTLTITQSNGSNITVDLSTLASSLECCNTSAFLSGTTLTINQSNGSPVSVDLSALSAGTQTQFYETISFQHSGPMTLNDSPEQNGWVACANATFSCGKLVYADDDGAGALNSAVTVQIYNCATNAVLSQASLPAGSSECAVVDMPSFNVFTNDVIKWRFVAFDAADADLATISMTFQKLQDIG